MLLVGALVVAAVMGPVPGASAEPGRYSGEDAELARRQVPMLEMADRLEEAGAGKESGYAGVELDVVAGVVHLYWKGDAPRTVASLVSGAPEGVRVEVHPAEHTAVELRERADEVIRTQGLSAGGAVHRVTPLPDGSGLEVGVTARAAVAAVSAEPLVVRAEVETPAPYDGRWGGGSPFEGGMQISSCSTSFSVMKLSFFTFKLLPKLVTAAHCYQVGDWVTTGNSSTGVVIVGQVQAVYPELDTALIAVDPGKFVTGWMWDGGVLDGSEYTKPVVGTSQARKGSLVCTSGAWSGVHCDIKITKTDSTLDWGTHVSKAVSIGDQMQNTLAAGGGDSGGPVFTLTSDLSSVLAAGVIIGGDDSRPATCTYRSSRCSTRVFFTDFRTVESHWVTRMPGQGPEGQ
ncbi:hypothetical protein GCM10009677_15810 [Sphaerisporangium rubeum]|uniref:S1 family peptidase n=1 Tax=Sphaerisporangium rubeum TaxID=321317 RepID=UPI0031D3488E